VTLAEGPAAAAAAVGAVLCCPGLGGGQKAALAVAGAGAAAFGCYDDLAGSGDRRGFRGHLGALASGELTSGAVKVGGIGVTGVAASALLAAAPAAGLRSAGAHGGGAPGVAAAADLLTVPAGRTRLLTVKYATVVVFCTAACLLIAAAAVATGAALFPVGPVTLLSGTSISLGAGLLRLLMVVLYVAAAMASLGAIGLAISTFTEHSIAAMAALLILTVGSEVADSVPQISAVHPYLPTHWWLSFDGLLRAPVAWPEVLHGLLSFAVYAVIFLAVAWARFTTMDVTS
jgi:ABC-2 type transport system permease protein